MALTPVQDLRRIAEAVGGLNGHAVRHVEIRSDCRQLKVTLDNGQLLLVSVLLDDDGKPRLDVDLVRAMVDVTHRQLEVRMPGRLERLPTPVPPISGLLYEQQPRLHRNLTPSAPGRRRRSIAIDRSAGAQVDT